MFWMWTCDGKCFGYLDGDDLWTSGGQHAGKLHGKEIYDQHGMYRGEVINENRLIFCATKRGWHGFRFSPLVSRPPLRRQADLEDFAMPAGYRTFSPPDSM